MSEEKKRTTHTPEQIELAASLGLEYVEEDEDVVDEYENTSCFPWGTRHYDYLLRYNPKFVLDMKNHKTLNKYNYEFNEKCKRMFDKMVDEIIEKNPVFTEELKSTNQMRWVGLVNNVKHSVEEIINTNYVYKKW